MNHKNVPSVPTAVIFIAQRYHMFSQQNTLFYFFVMTFFSFHFIQPVQDICLAKVVIAHYVDTLEKLV